jgi:hypothetical protein
MALSARSARIAKIFPFHLNFLDVCRKEGSNDNMVDVLNEFCIIQQTRVNSLSVWCVSLSNSDDYRSISP